jgi:hypothetical protein
MNTSPPLSRREFLRFGGATLALSSAQSLAAAPEHFEFIVVNDTHYIGEECREWHGRVAQAMKASCPHAAFCAFAGDVSDGGDEPALRAIREIYGIIGCPLAPVPGNHDHISDSDRSGYEAVFPGRLNYAFQHGDWQFLAIDSTQGVHSSDTQISEATLTWLDQAIPKLDPKKPVFAFTHFPLADGADLRPLNADEVVRRLLRVDLRWIHSGHWHGEKIDRHGLAILSINRCCARLRGNRDGSPLKGWHVYRATPAGELTRRFVEIPRAS